ncbi:hypothetical protein SAY87_015102 [Trapa incisa]|uniref:Decapping nuclease n=1 Tax=Trapa incisa TaxID=236973 RepID=A0AAN7GPN7_9MYRT|nr:hypothetical protein SAY87_015102 [Trapa incisa]
MSSFEFHCRTGTSNRLSHQWKRDDAGRLVRTERLRTNDITQRVKIKNYWQGGVCLAFADEVLCWLFGTVKEKSQMKTTSVCQVIHSFRASSSPTHARTPPMVCNLNINSSHK